ncbi:MAG: universal stress protein [Anaerolineae bacterium]|jgi:nucleotide-binding universal stress UspA family protein
MSEEGLEPAIRRILVALDASPHSLAALEAAAELAAGLKAELLGLFVEDINLLRLAELPFAREMGDFSTTRRQLDILEVERELRAQASRARRALAIVAGRAQVPWSFRVARGMIAAELLTAATEADLVILGKVGWSPTGRRHMGSTARAVLSQATCLTLILQEGVRLSLPILVVYDGSTIAQKALAAAIRLVRGKNGYLTVLILADGPDVARKFQTSVTKWLRERGLEARYRWLVGADVRHLPRIVDAEGCGMLVLPGQHSRVQSQGLLVWLDEVTCPVLLVR